MHLRQRAVQERQDLVDRVNILIMKHSLDVPRLVSSRFINYQFWSVIFTQLFRVKCDISLRTMNQRVEMIRSCLNTLESLIGISLDHIKPLRLLNYDIDSIVNLLEIAEVWSEYNDEIRNNKDVNNVDVHNVITQNHHQPFEENSQSNDLANRLYKALKNQIIALEIENKIKVYLGDVTIRKHRRNDNRSIQASRQSIVRTRTIQPLATFDFDFTREDKRSPILSVDLERWFPGISIEKLNKIRHLEHNLLLLERNICSWHHNRLTSRLSQMLSYAIEKQRRRIKLLSQRELETSPSSAQNQRKQMMPESLLQRETRSRRAAVHEEINQFYKSATASYLNARSYLERILVEEFRKVEAHQRDHINEIRKYLRHHNDNLKLDKVRAILESIEQIL